MEGYYPGTNVKITGPTYHLECLECGQKSIALLPSEICGKCGGRIKCMSMPDYDKQKNSA